MHPLLQRTLMAYRPLYLNGLLLDGQYKLPRTDPTTDPAGSPGLPRPRQRILLAALTHFVFQHRSKG
ncbi:MAG: hypothetical protein A2211_15600 [Rhodanobacter sp. RIFOXYA1_FULL_67_6]|nr:hypothetical protein [Rhodanobacter denitrificans]OHC43913.1 MAG: hypothetical protein A2211_15600 [Rhodanobacter sp. RIFOXYA1_FULL_67_6]